MEMRIQIKEEEPLAHDQASQNEREFVHDVVPMNTSIDTVLVDTDCDVTVKTEVKLQTRFIKTETATCSNNWEEHRETEIDHQTVFSDFGSQNVGVFPPEDPLMLLDMEYNNDHEIHNKMEIKEEPWSLETETSSVCDNIKDGELPLVQSSRLYPETSADVINDKSPYLVAEVPGRDTSSCIGIDGLEYEYKKCDVTCDDVTAKDYIHSDQYGKCSDKPDRDIQHLSLKDLLDTSIRPQQCSICHKSFSSLSCLKHFLLYEDKKRHQCKFCHKSFTHTSSLKAHILVHEGKKPHQCKVCDKRFTYVSTLKAHILLHEGKKSHQCKVCNKSFSHPSNLKSHILIHEGKKPHLCKVCNKSFTQLSTLKRHNLVHEGKEATPL